MIPVACATVLWIDIWKRAWNWHPTIKEGDSHDWSQLVRRVISLSLSLQCANCICLCEFLNLSWHACYVLMDVMCDHVRPGYWAGCFRTASRPTNGKRFKYTRTGNWALQVFVVYIYKVMHVASLGWLTISLGKCLKFRCLKSWHGHLWCMRILFINDTFVCVVLGFTHLFMNTFTVTVWREGKTASCQ